MASSSTGSRLLKLPAELRNQIYELVITSDWIPHMIALDSDIIATPPDKILPLVNRQLYHETRKIYRKAYQQFWQSSSLVVASDDVDAAEARLNAVDDKDIQHVQRVLFRVPARVARTSVNIICELIDRRGIWKTIIEPVAPTRRSVTRFCVHGRRGRYEESSKSTVTLDLTEAQQMCDALLEEMSVKEQVLRILSGIGRLHRKNE